jgi:hypothetical protein
MMAICFKNPLFDFFSALGIFLIEKNYLKKVELIHKFITILE